MTSRPDLRAAVIGAGRLGTFHARVYSELPGVELRYIVDVDPVRAGEAVARYGGEARRDYRDILDDIDLATVATPTTTHHGIARACLDARVSVLVEKPMTTTVEEADDLIRLAAERDARLQVGHIERFNPAYRAVREFLRDPVFIECHRLSPYPFRSTDVSVVLDLMIHDLDLILDLAGAETAAVEAAGVPVLSKGTDIANARLQLDRPGGRPGCVANVTASRISPRAMRRLRVFQPDAYVSMDLLAKKAYVFRKKEGFDVSQLRPDRLEEIARLPGDEAIGRLLDIRRLDLGGTDALRDEVAAFVAAVRDRTPPPVPGEHGRRALALAVSIDDAVRRFLAARNT